MQGAPRWARDPGIEATTHEVRNEISEILKLIVVPAMWVRTLLGKAVCIASLLPTERPLLAMTWAPLYAGASFKQPGMMWVKPSALHFCGRTLSSIEPVAQLRSALTLRISGSLAPRFASHWTRRRRWPRTSRTRRTSQPVGPPLLKDARRWLPPPRGNGFFFYRTLHPHA